MKDVVIIFGYNNTRIFDVEKIKKMCERKFGANILLCKDIITDADRELTQFTLDLSLEIDSIENIFFQMQRLDAYLEGNQLNPVACLPFADRGVPMGSAYAHHRGLNYDELRGGFGCINKFIFRCLESEAKVPSWYKKPAFSKFNDFESACKFLESAKKPVFFKPTCEGNSRGCMRIETVDELTKNRKELEPYFEAGVIAEESIEDCEEFSFDGVDNFFVITEKQTTKGLFRAETQQIVPAPLEKHEYERLIEAGQIISKIAGSNGGAIHNEIFLNRSSGEVYCVEPNRRPAGMKIWDLIKIAFDGADNWDRWLSWAAGKRCEQTVSAQPPYFVGIRMVQARVSGTVQEIDRCLETHVRELVGVVEVALYKKVGDQVSSMVAQNGDFIGHVICKNKSVDELKSDLLRIEENLANAFKVT